MAINYVKFIRGTPTAFARLSQKDNDTLYFISEVSSKKGSLYLGEKLISESIANLEDLSNILLENVQDKNLLSYDANSEKWINKPIIDAIGLMTGATTEAQGAAGLVPAPGIGQDGLFLRGDGVWATPVGGGSNVDVKPDEKTISFSSDGVTIALKDFGVKYYKYIPESNGVKAHYEAQVVNASNPWKEGLEAKVTVDDNGQFVLGWFEENPELNEKIDELTSKIGIVDVLAKENAIQITNIKTSVTNLTDLLNIKADVSNVYTKTEVDAKILEAGHLTRKTFQTLEEANNFIASVSNPEAYIYMVASSPDTNNKYAEYLYVDGELEFVGSWDVNLSNYVTKSEFQTISTQVSNIESLLNNKVDKSEIKIISTQISDIESLLNGKADKTEVITISNNLGSLTTRVGSLEEFMNSDYFNKIDKMETDLNTVKEAVIWKDL